MYRLTKFEISKIIGQRAEQISSGAMPCVDVSDCKTAVQIAEKEFLNNQIPIAIDRKFPNGKVVVLTNKDIKS